MFDTSFPSRDDPRLKEYSMMFPNKLNPQEFLLCANEEIMLCPCVLEYATLAINLSLLQHSHLKLDTLDRTEQSFCSSKSARSRHYYLASDHTIHRAFKRALLKKMNLFDDVRL